MSTWRVVLCLVLGLVYIHVALLVVAGAAFDSFSVCSHSNM